MFQGESSLEWRKPAVNLERNRPQGQIVMNGLEAVDEAGHIRREPGLRQGRESDVGIQIEAFGQEVAIDGELSVEQLRLGLRIEREGLLIVALEAGDAGIHGVRRDIGPLVRAQELPEVPVAQVVVGPNKYLPLETALGERLECPEEPLGHQVWLAAREVYHLRRVGL